MRRCDPVPLVARTPLRVHLSAPALFAFVLLSACATVPKEAVELSYQVGQDLSGVQRSMEALVQERFDDFERERLAYLEDEWVPLYLLDWIENGMLVETAQGRVVWSDAENDFVAPTPGREAQQLLDTVREWADWAVYDIDEKRNELLEPLAEQEAAILADLRETFSRLITANAHITAHLNSIRDVQEVQSEALDALGLQEVVTSLNDGLVRASEAANEGLESIRRADGLVDRAADIRDSLGRNGDEE